MTGEMAMTIIPRLIRALAPAVLASLASLAAIAQNAGTVQFATGTVEIQRGAQRLAAAKGTAILQGDVIATAADSTVQVTMIDGALLSLRPGTRMAIERYAFEPATPSSGGALLRLLGGTMRTFTGLIVANDRSKFRMQTDLASVGVRGTGNILAHGPDFGTVNHTLTGAHAVTAPDPAGIERTLVSYPGQTIQVLPGQLPRFIPTPPFILAGASKATRSASAEQRATEQTSTTTGQAAGEATSVGANVVDAGASVAASQAATSTLGGIIVAIQPAASAPFEALVRAIGPISIGYENIIGQTTFEGSGGAVLDASGRLVLLRNASISGFLSGAGALPPGYDIRSASGADVTFSGGLHHDGFRTPDGAITIGRWQGGSIVATGGDTPGGLLSFPLGPSSATYDVTIPIPPGVFASLTGTATYSLLAATAPADALGHTGSVGSAVLNANFSNQQITGAFAFGVNGQSFNISGQSAIGAFGNFDFATVLQNISIGCTGSNCASQGYQSTMNGRFAGDDGRWATVTYRLNQVRSSGQGFSDIIVGSMVLGTSTPPTVGIVLPQTGSRNFAFTGVDVQGFTFFGPPINDSPPPDRVTGSIQANFSTRTVSVAATIGSSTPGSPTYAASTTNAPIVGSGFSASTSPSAGVGVLTVSCSGSPCGAPGSAFGRFDGYFTSSAANQGRMEFSTGDSLGAYAGRATFAATASLAQMALASDVRRGIAAIGANPGAAAGTLQSLRVVRMRPPGGG